MLLLAISYPATSYGQTPVTISKEIVKVNGKLMYAHGVKKQETLYSISKAYKISIEELQKYNPSLASGLKEGTLLYIPVTAEQDVSVKPTEEEKNINKNEKGDVSAQSKKTQNAKEQNEAEGKTAGNSKYIVHEVKWYEDLDDIANEYHMDKSVIVKENNITDQTLYGVHNLRIPIAAINSKTENAAAGGKTENSTDKKQQPEAKENHYVNAETTESNTPVKVAIILPLNSKSATPNTNYMDFYAGALLAVNDIKGAGANLTINVIDQSEYPSSQAIISSGKLTGSNLIIGPERSSSIKEFIPYINKHSIPLVSPLDPAADSLLEKSKFLFQAVPSSDSQFHNLVLMAKEEYDMTPGCNVVVVFQNGGTDAWAAHKIIQYLNKEGIKHTEFSYGILQGRTIGSAFKQKIATDKNNIVIVPSFNEAFVSDVLRNLDILEIPDKISIYGTPKWRSFEAVDIAEYNKYGLKLSMPFYVDLSDGKVQTFTRQYRALYNAEPSANAFCGYDVMMYFTTQAINGLQSKLSEGEEYPESFEKANMLQQEFWFSRKKSNAGFENVSTTGITYGADYSVKTD